jgi:hypothetical protein
LDDAAAVSPGPGALLLLFPRGQRPDPVALRSAVERTSRLAITHDPASDGDPIEVLRDGLTFDFVGLAPGPSVRMSDVRHRFGREEELFLDRKDAIAIQPGAHVAAGARTMPVVRTMMSIVADLASTIESLRALLWSPSAALIGPDFFASSVNAWLAGGPFPALGLTAFAPNPDGALQSEGLAFFTGQELRLDPELSSDRTAGARLAMRLVNLMVARGRIDAVEEVAGTDLVPLILAPSADRAFVDVRRG